MYRFAHALVVTLLPCFIFSCDDSKETSDTNAPDITVESPIENQTVAGTIAISATADDLTTVTGMQAFVDGTLLKESSDSEILVQVDSKTLSEGTHVIKITATDNSGNTGQKIVNVEVRNTLFTVQVPSEYVTQYSQIYFALSKNDGTLIAVREVENGGMVSIPTPSDFNPDSSFVFTEYFYYDQPSIGSNLQYLIKNMNVYGGLNAGVFYLPEYVSSPAIGTHHVQVTDIPPDHFGASLQGRNIGPSSSYIFGNDGTLTAELGMMANTSDLFFSLPDVVPVYKYISSIKVGESTNFSVTGLPQMQQAFVTTRDASGNFTCYVGGYTDDPKYAAQIYSNTISLTEAKAAIYYPDNAYPEFFFRMSHASGIDTYENNILSSTPPTSFQYINANVENVDYLNRQLKVTTSGNFDIVSITGGTSSVDNNVFRLNAFTVSIPFGTKNKIVIPNIPDEVSNLEFESPDDFIFHQAALYDYAGLSTSDDYKNKIVFSSDNVFRHNRAHVGRVMATTPTNSGGRQAEPKRIRFPKTLETILQNHLPVGVFSSN